MTEYQLEEDKRGEGFPNILHERARTAAEEFHRLLVSISTTAVGVFFFSLTGRTDPPLTQAQQVVVLVAMFSMVVASTSGIACWHADSRRHFFWARGLQAAKSERRTFFAQRNRWMRIERETARALKLGFVVGITASLAFLTLRVLSV
jgi:hypothetical protein